MSIDFGINKIGFAIGQLITKKATPLKIIYNSKLKPQEIHSISTSKYKINSIKYLNPKLPNFDTDSKKNIIALIDTGINSLEKIDIKYRQYIEGVPTILKISENSNTIEKFENDRTIEQLNIFAI